MSPSWRFHLDYSQIYLEQTSNIVVFQQISVSLRINLLPHNHKVLALKEGSLFKTAVRKGENTGNQLFLFLPEGLSLPSISEFLFVSRNS